MPSRLALLLCALSCALSACGGDAPPAAPEPGTCALLERVPTWGREPMRGTFYAQEVWISYHSKDPNAKGYRYPRKKYEAEMLAKALCGKVHAGDDIGDIAREYSNANGAVARGIVQLPVHANRAKPDARDIAIFRVKEGELTPLIEWNGGYWFARRISLGLAMKLVKLLETERKRRARARVIHIHHAGAWPRRYEFDNFTKQQAIDKAWAIIRTIEHGADFKELAGKHSNDGASRERGGLLKTKHPLTGEETEWIRWGDKLFSQPLLDVILLDDKCAPGKMYPAPVLSKRGVDIVMVLERRTD